MLHVSSTGWDDHLSSDSIQALLWRFTPRRTSDPLPADIQRDHESDYRDGEKYCNSLVVTGGLTELNYALT